MIARRRAWLTLAVTLVVAAASACAGEDVKPVSKELEFGALRVRVTVREVK